MNFLRLKKLRDDLLKMTNKSIEEDQLLQELISLEKILDKNDFSLSLSSGVCKSCGRSFK